jgi:hypothetical protein
VRPVAFFAAAGLAAFFLDLVGACNEPEAAFVLVFLVLATGFLAAEPWVVVLFVGTFWADFVDFADLEPACFFTFVEVLVFADFFVFEPDADCFFAGFFTDFDFAIGCLLRFAPPTFLAEAAGFLFFVFVDLVTITLLLAYVRCTDKDFASIHAP